MKRIPSLFALAVAGLGLSGCGVTKDVRDDIAIREPIAKEFINHAPVRAQSSNFIEVRGAKLRAVEVEYNKNKGLWLKKIPFSYRAANAVPLTQIVAAIAAKGVNIVNDLPIDSITFMGTIPTTDMETALRQVLGSVGLDYSVDDATRLVTIQPLPSRTWKLPIGERTSNFSSNFQGSGSNTQGGGSNSNSSLGQTSQSGSQATSSNTTSGSGSATNTATNSSGGDSGSGGQTGGFYANDNFWSKLKTELEDRLQVMLPVPRGGSQGTMAAAMPSPINGGPIPQNFGNGLGMDQLGAAAAAGGSSGDIYVKKKIGTFALNPNTRTVTVYAPHWILKSLDSYFRDQADSLTTQIAIKGIMILVSKTKSNTEGIDIQNFATWAAGRYGAVVSNNALGGVTVNFDGKIPSVSTGNPTLGGPMLGVVSAPDGLKLFNNYMQQFGNTYVVQEPRIATTPGVAAKFSNIVTDFYVKVGQNASAGNTGSAIVANTNELQPIDFGTELSVYPTYDTATGIVRALIVSKSTVKDGTKNLPQYLSSGTTQTQVNQSVPIPRKLNYEGEALLRDGDMIVFGGQTDETMTTDESGIPGPDGPLGGALGTKSATRGGGTYYFALKVSVSKL